MEGVSAANERWHGTSGGYTNHHCKCIRCLDAWATDVAARNQKKSAMAR